MLSSEKGSLITDPTTSQMLMNMEWYDFYIELFFSRFLEIDWSGG